MIMNTDAILFKEWCDREEQIECQREQRTLSTEELYYLYIQSK